MEDNKIAFFNNVVPSLFQRLQRETEQLRKAATTHLDENTRWQIFAAMRERWKDLELDGKDYTKYIAFVMEILGI